MAEPLTEDAGKSETITLKELCEKGCFADYFFVGVDLNGKRWSFHSIGENGADHEFSNCERWDRMVGAVKRLTMQMEIETPPRNEDL